jgi:uncharacterized UBP type Zn finger protein
MFMSLCRTSDTPSPRGYYLSQDFANSSILSLDCLLKIKCARDVLWKDITLGVACTIIFPAGLIYLGISAAYCLVKKCPLKLIFFPFMRQAAFLGGSISRKTDPTPTADSHTALPLGPKGNPSSPGGELVDGNPPLTPNLPIFPFLEPSGSVVGPVEGPAPAMEICAGIPNFGATCYMNASLQALYRCEPFSPVVRSLCKVLKGNAEFDVICFMGEIFEYFANPKVDGSQTQPCPRELVTKFFAALNANTGWKYSTSDQCDAHEFMIVLLDHVETCAKRLTQSRANDFVDKARAAGTITDDEISALHLAKFYQPGRSAETPAILDFGFSFSMQTLVQEVVDGQPVGNQFEARGESAIFINVGLETGNLHGALSSLVAPETVEKYTFPGDRKGRAVRQSTFVSLPSILPIQLGRFKYNLEASVSEKVNDRFEFPDEIDLSQFTMDPKTSMPYRLSTIVTHSGTPTNGHYVTYVQIGDRWYEFNDSGVREVSTSKIKALCGDGTGDMSAYILFYEKVT